MSNHFHLVLYRDPDRAPKWTDLEVAERWLGIFPPKTEDYSHSLKTLLLDASKLVRCRYRLASISWFMRCLKEPLARSANKEDQCTGRFWEGRYRSQALLDKPSILSCMAYVDLNPIRAGRCRSIETAAHTSIHERLLAAKTDSQYQQRPLGPLAVTPESFELSTIHLAEYLDLLRWSTRRWRTDENVNENPSTPLLLQRLPHTEKRWLEQMQSFERDWRRAAGSVKLLRLMALKIGQKYLHGLTKAQSIYGTSIELLC